MEQWLIDGYNLLYHIQRKEKAPDKAHFFSQLSDFSAMNRCEMTVVLDGIGNDEELKIHETPHFHVLYSKGVSADAHIERCLFERKKDVQYTVITKDRAISQIARGVGARVFGAAEFLAMLKESRIAERDILWKADADAHGFNRPFNKKLKPK